MMFSRKVVTRRGRGFRGYYPSRKLGRMVAWESLLERDAILLLEFSPEVSFYREQPVLIQYSDGEQIRDYYPDFEAILSDGSSVHFEVKTVCQLKKPEIAAKFSAIAYCYKQRQQEFRIVTEEEIRREPLLTNVHTLAYFAVRPGPELPTSRTLNALFGSKGLSFCRAEEILTRETLLRLIVTGQLYCDLDQPLGGSAMVTLDQGGHHETYLP